MNIDSLAFWEAPDLAETLMFVTAKGNQLVEVWQYPFVSSELPPLTHPTFASGSKVNGVAVDQERDRLYVSVSGPASALSVFSLPDLTFVDDFVAGAVSLGGEPNLTLLRRPSGQTWAYVSADTKVYIYDAETSTQLGQFSPSKGLETLVADDFYQVIYVPDENGRSGVYAYRPDGSPYERNGSNNFGGGGIFQSDAEGITLYGCLSPEGADQGQGLIVVADQRSDQTDFEVFDRDSWAYLGTFRVAGVSNTDGIASTQRPLPGYPLGLFAAHNNDRTVLGVSWETILAATGLSCDGSGSSNQAPTASDTAVVTDEGAPIETALSASDPEECELVFSTVNPPTNGSLSTITGAACIPGSPNTDMATVTYTPNSGFDGSDSFTYMANDGTDDSNVATVSVTVNPVVTDPGGGGATLAFNPTDDAHVRSSSPTSNYGTLDHLRVRSGSPEYHTYLKFDLTGVAGTVTKATLRLFVNDASPNSGSVYLVSNNYSTGGPWDEDGLTWQKAPAIAGSPLDSAGATSAATWLELDVTGAVTGSGIVSFGISTPSSNSSYFASKEDGTNLPELVVEMA